MPRLPGLGGGSSRAVRRRKGESCRSSSLPKELLELRASIDNIDAALIHMLAERFRCTKAVGVLKAKNGLAPG